MLSTDASLDVGVTTVVEICGLGGWRRSCSPLLRTCGPKVLSDETFVTELKIRIDEGTTVIAVSNYIVNMKY